MKINNILQEYNYSPEEEDKAQDMRKYIERKSGVLWAEAFWRAWRETGNAEAARRLMPKHYKQMINSSEVNTDQPIEEAMSDAYGMVSAEPEVEGSVEFKQHKNTDKGSVSIEASGDNMQELAKVLKLAGLTLPKDMYSDEQASADDQEPEQEDVLLSPDHKDDEEKSPCDSADTDVSYETDKEILINYIKDKLKKSIS